MRVASIDLTFDPEKKLSLATKDHLLSSFERYMIYDIRYG